MKALVSLVKIPIKARLIAVACTIGLASLAFAGKHEITLSDGGRIENAAITGATIFIPAGSENVVVRNTRVN